MIKKINLDLDAEGTTDARSSLRNFQDLLKDILDYSSNPKNLDNYFESTPDFRTFVKENLK